MRVSAQDTTAGSSLEGDKGVLLEALRSDGALFKVGVEASFGIVAEEVPSSSADAGAGAAAGGGGVTSDPSVSISDDAASATPKRLLSELWLLEGVNDDMRERQC